MARPISSRRRRGTTTVSIGAVVAIAALTLAGSSVATAATSLAGPLDLGTSTTFGVLAGGSLTEAIDDAANLSVWVFQAASSLTIQSGTRIDLQGGASACNVFWLVGSSATLVDGAQFVGTILSRFDISVGAAATGGCSPSGTSP